MMPQSARFPISTQNPVAYPGPIPAEVDCVVIGGGIIGIMTGWHLVQMGLRAVVVEKGRVAGEQSSRNWGWIRQQGRDPAELPIMVEAAALWRELAQRCGPDLGLRQTGVLYLADKPSGLASYENWLVHAADHGIDTKMVTANEVSAMMPAATKRWAGGLWTASDMRAEPFVAVPRLAQMAAKDGLGIVENCAVRALDLAAGRVAGVVTEQGLIKAPLVVVAGGAWSSLFLRAHGVTIPQLSVRATVAATGPLPAVCEAAVSERKISWRRREDGGFTLAPSDFHEMFIGPDAFRALPKYFSQLARDPFGTRYLVAAPKDYPDAWGIARKWSPEDVTPFERQRILDPAPHGPTVAGLQAEFAKLFPALGPIPIKRSWAGMIDAMPDVVPILDHAAQIPGLIVSTGMCGHGFGIGPAWGKATAALAAGRDVGHDLTRFRLARFSDGSRLILGPSL